MKKNRSKLLVEALEDRLLPAIYIGPTEFMAGNRFTAQFAEIDRESTTWVDIRLVAENGNEIDDGLAMVRRDGTAEEKLKPSEKPGRFFIEIMDRKTNEEILPPTMITAISANPTTSNDSSLPKSTNQFANAVDEIFGQIGEDKNHAAGTANITLSGPLLPRERIDMIFNQFEIGKKVDYTVSQNGAVLRSSWERIRGGDRDRESIRPPRDFDVEMPVHFEVTNRETGQVIFAGTGRAGSSQITPINLNGLRPSDNSETSEMTIGIAPGMLEKTRAAQITFINPKNDEILREARELDRIRIEITGAPPSANGRLEMSQSNLSVTLNTNENGTAIFDIKIPFFTIGNHERDGRVFTALIEGIDPITNALTLLPGPRVGWADNVPQNGELEVELKGAKGGIVSSFVFIGDNDRELARHPITADGSGYAKVNVPVPNGIVGAAPTNGVTTKLLYPIDEIEFHKNITVHRQNVEMSRPSAGQPPNVSVKSTRPAAVIAASPTLENPISKKGIMLAPSHALYLVTLQTHPFGPYDHLSLLITPAGNFSPAHPNFQVMDNEMIGMTIGAGFEKFRLVAGFNRPKDSDTGLHFAGRKYDLAYIGQNTLDRLIGAVTNYDDDVFYWSSSTSNSFVAGLLGFVGLPNPNPEHVFTHDNRSNFDDWKGWDDPLPATSFQ